MSFTLQPFVDASLAIQIHIVAALVAVALGLIVFLRRKGGRIHRLLGRIWFAAMIIVSVSSFFISALKTWGFFSPIHLLSLVTLATLAYALLAIKQRNIEAHKRSLASLFWGGLMVAGVLAFSRDLTMHRIVFGEGGGSSVPAFDAWPGGPLMPIFTALAAGLLGTLWGGRKVGRNRSPL